MFMYIYFNTNIINRGRNASIQPLGNITKLPILGALNPGKQVYVSRGTKPYVAELR